MSNVEGGRLLVKALKKEGVEYLFSLSGGHLFPIYDACLDEGIKIIDTRHEQAAAHMAEAWSLVTGKMGVCALTAGPGVTDGVTAVANAYQSNSPMLLLGGRSSLMENDVGTLQDMNQLAMMEPISKWARICHDTKRIPDYIGMAYRYAMSGRPGPAYLELPMDILFRQIEEDDVIFPTNYRTLSRPAGDPKDIEAAVQLLKEAQNPLILAGSGCLWSKASEPLKAFAEKTGIPVITRTAGRGVLPDSHELSLTGPMAEMMAVMVQADVILVLGSRFNFMLGFGRVFPPPKKVIQVDIEPTELGFNRGPDIGIFGDVSAVLEALTEKIPANSDRSWIKQAKETLASMVEASRGSIDRNASPIHPLRLVEDIRDIFGGDATYVLDGGDIMLWGNEAFPAERPASILSTGPLGCLGVGMPFANAAKLARPDKPVVLLSGDGSFGLNAMEFDTAIRHCIPVICVVGNDQAWGMIKHGQEWQYGYDRVACCNLGPVRYDRMVEGLGGHGEFVEKADDIKPAIERAIASGKPACINVITDPTIYHPGTKMMFESGIL